MKKEIICDFYNKILRSNILRAHLEKAYFEDIEDMLAENMLGIEDESYFERLFLKDIQDKCSRSFKFITFKLPKVDLCSSGVFTFETTLEINRMHKTDTKKYNEPLTEIYFNFLPVYNTSFVILGCAEERVEKCWAYISGFNREEHHESLKLLSDLLLCQVENWLCSPSFYRNNIEDRRQEIIKISNESVHHPDERRKLEFNLFDRLKLTQI